MMIVRLRFLIGCIAVCILTLLIHKIHSFPYGYSRANPDPYAKKKPVMNVIPQPPCCNDLIGTLACRRLRKNNLGVFLHRCEADPDFAMLQCCQTCGQQEVARRHANLFFDEENSKFCFDRHGHKFCETFMLKRDIWSPTSWSCSGENAQLAFRICRKTCGYCRRDLYAEERKPVPVVPLPLPPNTGFRRRRNCKSFV